MTEIRTFAEAERAGLTDRSELLALFARAGALSPSDSLWGDQESEAAVYLLPYLDLAPDSVLLAMDGERPAGYLAGCRDTSAFPGEHTRTRTAIGRYRLYRRRRPALFLARGLLDVVGAVVRGEPLPREFDDPRWPAHLHINVVPGARGTGAADALMDDWLGRLAEEGVAGCHLRTLAENTRAVRFFERKGFAPYGPVPLVPGARHRGRRVHQLTMVWSP